MLAAQDWLHARYSTHPRVLWSYYWGPPEDADIPYLRIHRLIHSQTVRRQTEGGGSMDGYIAAGDAGVRVSGPLARVRAP